MAAIGLYPTLGQIAGLVAAVLAGLVVARLLPYIYPVFDPLLTAAFGSGPSDGRDGFNTLMMTVITILTSFVIALVTSLLFSRRGRKA